MQGSRIIKGECLEVLKELETDFQESVSLTYIDPPFQTNKTQKLGKYSYEDKFDDMNSYIEFLRERIIEAKKLLKPNGSFILHLDWRTVHYAKIMMDEIFGYENFLNHCIWSYDYGGRSKKCWSKKHDDLLIYVQNKKDYVFNYDQMKRIPYMAPGLQKDKEKAKLGKPETDVIWQTICPTNGKERTGYPTQKPLKLLERLIKVHTNPGDLVLDFFCGSGTTLVAAAIHDRQYIGIDQNPEAVEIIRKRLGGDHAA